MCYSKKIVLCSIIFSIFFCFNESADKRAAFAAGSSDRVYFPGEVPYFHSGVDLGSNHFHQHHNHQHPQDEDYDDEGMEVKTSRPNPNLKTSENSYNNETGIPVSLIKEINDKGYSINDLLLHYVDDYEKDFLESRFGEEKAGVKIATEAKCMPELRTVPLIEKKDPNTFYIPSCTRIERCGGCCNHDLLECQAVDFDTLTVQVLRGSYKGGSNFVYEGKQLVSVEKHKTCKCDCKVKKSDCTTMQTFEKERCRCTCQNRDEEKKCLKENSTKLWNPNTCVCQCRQETMCTTGSVFDWKQCKCVVKQLRRRNAEQRRRNVYRYEVLPLIPFEEDN